MLPVGAGVGLLLLLLAYKYIILPAFMSPLSKIPNAHPLASVLPVWIWWTRLSGTGARGLLALHRKLGPVVRLGPNEVSVSVNSLDGLRAVYLGGFDRHWSYQHFENYGKQNLISMQDQGSHSVQKRAVSHVYSKSYLQISADLQRLSKMVIVDRFLAVLRESACQGAAVEVLELMKAVSMDMVSGYIFGSAQGTDFLRHVDRRRQWLAAFADFTIQSPKARAGEIIEQSCMAMCEVVGLGLQDTDEKSSSAAHTQPGVYEPLARRLSPSATAPTTDDRKAIASELLDHLIAGHETSGITLTYVMYQLSQRPELQSRLSEELLTLKPPYCMPHTSTADVEENSKVKDASDMPKPADINSLSLLDAIVQETLRLHAPVLAPQPRVTPQSWPPVRIDGYDIPGGVLVSCNAYSLHRNEEVFPNADEWMPERWVDADEVRLREMKRWFWAFSSGGRMCLGSHFAVLNIKKIVAAIYTNFATSIVNDTGIEQSDDFVAGPVGKKLVLRFKMF